MKKIFLSVLFIFTAAFLFSCTTLTTTGQNPVQDDEIVSDETIVENVVEAVAQNSKFVEYLRSIVSDSEANEVTYILERTVTVNGASVSYATAVSNGKILNIAGNGEFTTAEIFTPELHTFMDCKAKTYTQSPMDPTLYQQVLSSVECMSKYDNVEFTPSGYTVVDKDCYAEVAVINNIPKIFVFDDNGCLKYIIYTQEDGALVTEEYIAFTSSPDIVPEENFSVPGNYTLLPAAE